MQYWLRMNREELMVAQALLGGALPFDAFDVAEGYEPTAELVTDMVRKGFMVADAKTGALAWDDFALVVLSDVLHAGAELRVESAGGERLASLRFCGEDMVLLASEGAGYVLFYVPTLPKAVGGLAHELAWVDAAPEGDVLAAEGRAGGARGFSAQLVRVGDGVFELRGYPEEGARVAVAGVDELVAALNPWIVEAHRQALLAAKAGR